MKLLLQIPKNHPYWRNFKRRNCRLGTEVEVVEAGLEVIANLHALILMYLQILVEFNTSTHIN